MMSFFSEATKATWLIRAFGFAKIPMLYWCRPRILEINEQSCAVSIPLNRRTRNHEKCMYIAALTAGADIAGGVLAMYIVRKSQRKVRLLFKDFQANYLKRAEGEVVFTCNDGPQITAMAQEAARTKERQNKAIHITATVPSKLGDQPVATFVLTLSLKDVTDSKQLTADTALTLAANER